MWFFAFEFLEYFIRGFVKEEKSSEEENDGLSGGCGGEEGRMDVGEGLLE